MREDATTKRAKKAPLGVPCSLVVTSTDPSNPQIVRVRLPGSGGTFVIGRAATSALRIIDESISRVHCRIHVEAVVGAEGVELRIEDAESANGTRVDGQLLGSGRDARLHAGSVIEIGGFVGLVQPAEDCDPNTATMMGGAPAAVALSPAGSTSSSSSSSSSSAPTSSSSRLPR